MKTTKHQADWLAKPTAGHETHGQSAVYDTNTGKDIAIVYDGDAHASLIAAAIHLLAACQEAQEALDVLAQDAEEAGYPARAESATDLAMRIRTAIAKASQP